MDFNLAIIFITVLLTGLLSGILGMGGGSITMGVYGFILPVREAMILHAVTQVASNISRVGIHWKNIQWKIIWPFFMGGFFSLAFFSFIHVVPPKWLIFICLGIFPVTSFLSPFVKRMSIEKISVSIVCGILVIGAQLIAGVSGPILDTFFLKSKLTRYGILATMAVTQTFGHTLKFFYYAMIISGSFREFIVPFWAYPMIIVLSFFGNYAAQFPLSKMKDHQFQFVRRCLVLVVGSVFIWKGICEFLK